MTTAIAQAEDPKAIITAENDYAPILAEYVDFTPTSLSFKKKPPIKKWLTITEFTQGIRSKSLWWIGDSLNYGEREYGEKYAQAVDDHGKSESRLQTYASVCSRFEAERRNPRLSFDIHAECAYIDPREADALLKTAELKRWSKMDMRAEVAKINERNGVSKRGRKAGSTVAKLAASGKSPQETTSPAPTPSDMTKPPADIEAKLEPPELKAKEPPPLVWNGYPITVKDGKLCAGEILPDDEAEHCAHHFGFGTPRQMLTIVTKSPSHGATLPPAPPRVQQAPEPAAVAPQPKPAPAAPAPAKTPLAIAEEAILAFNHASLAVDWTKLGNLDRKKWLERLLRRADEVIDQIQGNPPTPRK